MERLVVVKIGILIADKILSYLLLLITEPVQHKGPALLLHMPQGTYPYLTRPLLAYLTTAQLL